MTEDYKERDNRFTGTIHSVAVELQKPKIAAPDQLKRAARDAAVRRTLTE